jgi:hypothetical protein
MRKFISCIFLLLSVSLALGNVGVQTFEKDAICVIQDNQDSNLDLNLNLLVFENSKDFSNENLGIPALIIINQASAKEKNRSETSPEVRWCFLSKNLYIINKVAISNKGISFLKNRSETSPEVRWCFSSKNKFSLERAKNKKALIIF